MLYPRLWLHKGELRRPGITDRVFFALQRLSDEDCLGEGRVYGGGLNKLEPHELARLRLDLDDDDLDLLRKETKNSQMDLLASGVLNIR